MKHGISYLAVDNTAIQIAIAAKKSKEDISYLKQCVAYNAVHGFEYDEVEFIQLANILANDYGFNPFKYKSVDEGAIYDKNKHPDASGRVRGRENINNKLSWVCLDVDTTIVSDIEMHEVLCNINHHIARTSDKDNPYKYRIIIELSKQVTVTTNTYKFFMASIANYLQIKIDNLGASQCFYGYFGRTVYSVIDKLPLDPSRHLEMALMKYSELEEKRATALPPGLADAALQQPFNTFGFAYDCSSGEGTTLMLGAIAKAKSLGASKEYIIDLLYSINNFWDHPMPIHRLQSTVMTAI